MNKIVELITEYEELNRVYEKIVKAKGVVSYPALKQVVNFYNQHLDLNELAKERLALRMDARDSYDDMLHLLAEEVKKNISIYEGNKKMFSTIDTKKIVQEHLEDFCKLDIEIQLKNTNQWGKKKTKAGNSLETLVYSYGVDSDEYEDAEQEYNKYDDRYKYERDILENLYKKREAERKEAVGYKEPHFNDIYDLGRKLLDRLEGWFDVENKNVVDSRADDSVPHGRKRNEEDYIKKCRKFFSLDNDRTSKIYNFCDDYIFEGVDKDSLSRHLRLFPCSSKLKIKDKMRIYAFALIDHIATKGNLTEDWKKEFVGHIENANWTIYVKNHNKFQTMNSNRSMEFTDKLRNLSL